jgi:dienelactone hydrolase
VSIVYGEARETRLLPFPSDRYTRHDPETATGRRVELGPGATADSIFTSVPGTAERMSELDGFSTVGGISVGFDGPVDGSWFADPAALPLFGGVDPSRFTVKGSPILLVVTDPDSELRGSAVGLLPRYFEQPKDEYFLEDEFSIVARPAVPLEPGTEYTFVVTTALTDAEGRPIARTPEMELLLGDEPGEYAERVRAGVEVISGALGLDRSEVLLASTFTTASVQRELLDAAAHERTRPPPAIVEPWEVESESADGRVRLRARFRTTEYRDDSGVFRMSGGLPTPQSDWDMEVFLAVAEGQQSLPRPVVIFQHGLGGDKDGCWGTAERLASLGVAVVAIDSPEHGDRGGAKDTLESVLGFFGVDPETLDFDIAKARDNFRQMSLDQLALVRFMQTQAALDVLPLGAPDGKPDLDVSRFLYVGHSFGGVQGPAIFALAPEIQHAVWNVGGDGMMFILEDSPLFSIFVDGLRPPGVADGALARFLSATQAIVDPGDGLNYARFVLDAPLAEQPRPRNVLLQQVIDDGIVPNTSTEAVARAAGLVLLNPVRPFPGAVLDPSATSTPRPDGSTGVITQFATMNGGEVATHGELIFTPEARAQYVEFFRTGIVHGTAEVEHTP